MDAGSELTTAERLGASVSARRLTVGTIVTGGGLFAGQAVTGLAFLLLARRSNAASYGAFFALYGASIAFGNLYDFGSSTRQLRDLASGRGRGSFRAWLVRRTVLQVPAFGLFVVMAYLLLHRQLTAVTILGLSVQTLSIPVSQGVLAAVRALRTPPLAVWLIAGGNVALLLAAIGAPRAHLLSICAVASAATWLITAIAGLACVRSLVPPCERTARNPWSGAAGFGLHGIANAIQSLDVAIVGAVAGAVVAGQFAAVDRWTQPILLAGNALAVQAFPAFAAARSDAEAILLLKSAKAVLIIGTLGVAGLTLASPWLVPLLLGSQYAGSVNLLRALAAASLTAVVSGPLAAWLQARGYETFVAKTSGAASVTVLLLIAVLARSCGAYAVPLAWVVGYGAQCGIWGRKVLVLGRDVAGAPTAHLEKGRHAA